MQLLKQIDGACAWGQTLPTLHDGRHLLLLKRLLPPTHLRLSCCLMLWLLTRLLWLIHESCNVAVQQLCLVICERRLSREVSHHCHLPACLLLQRDVCGVRGATGKVWLLMFWMGTHMPMLLQFVTVLKVGSVAVGRMAQGGDDRTGRDEVLIDLKR